MTDPAEPTSADPLRRAADTMRAVRDRCVWTQQIDHRALVPYLVEESAELVHEVASRERPEKRSGYVLKMSPNASRRRDMSSLC